jgi:YfiR/HmsC-like
MHCRRQVRMSWPLLGTVFLLLLPGPLLSCAQNVSEYQVKAAYLYNFSKFVEWPAQAFASPVAPIRLCVLKDQAFESELNQVVKGKTVGGRAVTVVPVQTGEQSLRCQILFIASSQDKQSRQIIDTLRNSSVLTVGESEGFVEKGGIINFVLQDDRVQLQVNHKAATQAGLHISSRLLSVAKLVIQ